MEEDKDIIEELWKIASNFSIVDQVKQFDEDWVKMTFLRILSYYRWNFIEKMKQGSEMDLIVYLWGQLDSVFHQLHVETKR